MSTITPRARRAAATGAALAAVLALSSCFGGQAPAEDDEPAPQGVGFDEVQGAVIQIEARGTFVHPAYGGYEAAGRGSGFLIDESGLALTNNHVVVGAGTLDVWRGGDQTKTLNARVLGSSECLDLAVIQLEGSGYPFLSWREGDITTATEVYAAGFPNGVPEFTLTRGIVSKASTDGDDAWANVDTVIEHDARIRPGNSGGALIDGDGRVLGVNYAGNDAFDYSWAIHRDEVLAVLDQLIAGENVLSLGINGQGITAEDGTGLGIWVSSVAAGSIADRAGVEPGDVLTRMQGVGLGRNGTLKEYCDVLRTHGQDSVIDIELYRPSDGLYHRGQFNGDPIEAVQVLSDTPTPSGEFVDVTDDTNSVYVQVPATWTQLDGTPRIDPVGNEWATISASPNLEGYHTTWSTPGVTVMASPGALANTTVDSLLTGLGGVTGDGCVSHGRESYADGYHTGQYEFYTGCGSSNASFLALAAISDDGNYLVYLTVQAISDADLAAADRVLGSFIAQF